MDRSRSKLPRLDLSLSVELSSRNDIEEIVELSPLSPLQEGNILCAPVICQLTPSLGEEKYFTESLQDFDTHLHPGPTYEVPGIPVMSMYV